MEFPVAVMVSEKVKKEVVYSLECSDQKPLDSNTQLIVEYTKMTVPELMEPRDQHDDIRKADAIIDIVKGGLKFGALYPPAAPVCLFLAGVGSGIQWIMKLIPDDRPDPVVEKYKELEESLHELEKVMDAHFADMQSFITEVNFHTNITAPAKTLWMYTRNCLKYQTKQDAEDFAEEYIKTPPMSMAYSLAALLDNKTSNPLLMAMDNEKIKTKGTFMKWKNIISGIFGEFLFIEAFARGLLNKSDYGQNKITKEWESFKEILDGLEDKYKKENGNKYWKELDTDIKDLIARNVHLNNVQRGELIRKRVDNCLTDDQFYICVSNYVESAHRYCYCPDSANQLICRGSKPAHCLVWVYRSRKASTLPVEKYVKLRDHMKTIERGLTWNDALKYLIKIQFISKPVFADCGLYLVLNSKQADPQIFSSNSVVSEDLNGPGHVQKMWLVGESGGAEYQSHFIVGFK